MHVHALTTHTLIHTQKFMDTCNIPIFQTLSKELRLITLLATEFYCIDVTDLIF